MGIGGLSFFYSCHKLVRSFLAKKTTQWLQKNAILVYNLLLFWASCQSGYRLKLCILYFTPLSGYFDKKGILTFFLTRKYFHRPKWPGNQKGVFCLSVCLKQRWPGFPPHLGSLLTLQVSGMLLRNDPRE